MTDKLDTTATSKSIITLLRAECAKLIESCECGGSGVIPEMAYVPPSQEPECVPAPCKTCSPLREMEKELCWHEWEGVAPRKCGKCGEWTEGWPELTNDNPDLTTAMSGDRFLLVDWLERAGLLEGFIEWLAVKHVATNTYYARVKRMAKILFTGTYLCQAVEAFLKERA